MNIKVSANLLLERLLCVSGILDKSSKQTIPNAVCFEVKDYCLYIKAFNEVSSLSVIHDIEADCEMSFVIDAEPLIKFLKGKASVVDITLNEDSSIIFVHKRSKFSSIWSDSKSFPYMPVPSTKGFFIKSGYFVPLLKRSFGFLKREDELRPEISRVFIECKNGVMNMVSTDRNRLFKSTKEIEDVEDFEFLISESAASLLYNYISDKDIDINISHDDRRLYMVFDDVIISDIGMEARFPNFRAIFDNFSLYSGFRHDKRELISFFESLLISGSDYIDITVDKNELKAVSSNPFDRKSVESSMDMDESFHGESSSFCVTGGNFISSLKNAVGNNINIEYSIKTRSIRISNPDYPQESILCTTVSYKY